MNVERYDIVGSKRRSRDCGIGSMTSRLYAEPGWSSADYRAVAVATFMHCARHADARGWRCVEREDAANGRS